MANGKFATKPLPKKTLRCEPPPPEWPVSTGAQCGHRVRSPGTQGRAQVPAPVNTSRRGRHPCRRHRPRADPVPTPAPESKSRRLGLWYLQVPGFGSGPVAYPSLIE